MLIAILILAALVVGFAGGFAAGCIHMVAKNQGRPL